MTFSKIKKFFFLGSVYLVGFCLIGFFLFLEIKYNIQNVILTYYDPEILHESIQHYHYRLNLKLYYNGIIDKREQIFRSKVLGLRLNEQHIEYLDFFNKYDGKYDQSFSENLSNSNSNSKDE